MALREKYVKALTIIGYKEIKRTPKYIVFKGVSQNFYVGKVALRIGNTSASSIPASKVMKAKLIAIAERGYPEPLVVA